MFNTRNAILFALMTAFIVGMNWALVALSKAMEFSNFIVFGLCLIATMIAGGYAWDWWTAAPRDNHDRRA
ncbi:hypothetical protein IVB18_24445 [Bradyrhizobium sp. 186]|uniref:hypothetical protein n=1 Tax=Bradyrhizobium sp. 186 TaxID=2782654 RepID=UPI002001BD2B|nr:hypothetical protein [Bradyrhizobium sp. 186]UPK40099.1 hypothetical protein IVB18_24445 [Bradyrhizobium sp. 186]